MNYGAEIAIATMIFPFLFAFIFWTKPPAPPSIEKLLLDLIRAILRSL